MSIEIVCKQALTLDEEKNLFEWSNDPFGMAEVGLEWIQWLPEKWHMVAYKEQIAISHVGILKQTLLIGQQSLSLGGIAGVVTIPSSRGKGYAHQLLECSLNFMRDKLQVDFGLLFCLPRLVPFYEGLGWTQINNDFVFMQASGRVNTPLPVMTIQCKTLKWPSGKIELGSYPW